jgi:hypothetical protein
MNINETLVDRLFEGHRNLNECTVHDHLFALGNSSFFLIRKFYETKRFRAINKEKKIFAPRKVRYGNVKYF